eukprot:scaffold4052_cov226-Pinguiococcus_pyrenoidosus.AAC.1
MERRTTSLLVALLLVCVQVRGFAPSRSLARSRTYPLRCTGEAEEAAKVADQADEGEAAEMTQLKEEIAALEAANRKLRQSIEEAEAAASSSGERGYMGLVAQLDNYRKSQAGAQARIREQALGEVLRAFVPVLESIESLPESIRGDVPESQDPESEVSRYLNSYNTIGRQLWSQMTEKGLAKFSALPGVSLDPLRHEVVEVLGEDEAKGGLVDTCIADGFAIGQTVLKKAQVAAYRVPAPK